MANINSGLLVDILPISYILKMVNPMVTSSEVNASAAYARSVLPNSLIDLVCFTEKKKA